jgi:hypothetical protein
MLSINQRFGKHCSCHLQGECVVGRVLEALYKANIKMTVFWDVEPYGLVVRLNVTEDSHLHIDFTLHRDISYSFRVLPIINSCNCV